MLQQILRDMWVDPEILAELDETMKQTLFCKMREEQVRRWRLWDQKVSQEETGKPKFQKSNGLKKHVQFLKGEDGEPWVWVMGEHSDDKSIETILAEETRKNAIEQVRMEAHQFRKSVEKELTQLIDYKPLDSLEQKFDLSPKTVDSLEDTLEIYCTVDELRQRIGALEPELNVKENSITGDCLMKIEEYRNGKNLKIDKNMLNFNFIEGKRDVLQELRDGEAGGAGGAGVGNRVAAWERRVAAARASDLLRRQRQQQQDQAWRDQERKAKEAEATMREIARAAREEHRRSVATHTHAESGLQVGKPSSREAVIEWFRTKEMNRGAGLDENNKPAEWFHGLITRSEAERLLSAHGRGAFLVRVSERVWGYAISYRGGAGGAGGAEAEPEGARCKHFLVEAAPRYRLLGAARADHHSLADLIKHHSATPITESGKELLTTPCRRAAAPAILLT